MQRFQIHYRNSFRITESHAEIPKKRSKPLLLSACQKTRVSLKAVIVDEWTVLESIREEEALARIRITCMRATIRSPFCRSRDL